jgi:glycosyltransferase involved in cell wall biosynthesis
LPFVAPLLAAERYFPKMTPDARERLIHAMLNRAVMFTLRPCDVFICMSGIYLEAARFARRRFGAQVWLERGSRHILSQDWILAEVPGAKRPSETTIQRELAGYALADRIVIPSTHVEESFRDDPSSFRKLFRNPYGVDLSMFPLCATEHAPKPLRLLYAGSWSLRKGCDVLLKAVKRVPGATLTHVGPIVDMVFPEGDPQFTHVAAVSQNALSPFFCGAQAFVLASREDGLSVVLSQALASGLPIICTDRTGGIDLAHTAAMAARITVVPNGDVDTFADAIASRCAAQARGECLPPLSDRDRETLSWAAYARRYSNELVSTCGHS